MYFLGKDVIHPSGNQLKAFGFDRSPSSGLKGTSCYTLERNESCIQLYGSCAGLYKTDSQIVFLRKRCRFYQWLPQHKLVAGQWNQEQLCAKNAFQLFESLTPLLQWWIEYEKWITGKFGTNYRCQCYSEWQQVKAKTSWLPPQKAQCWVEQLLIDKLAHKRPKHFS